MYDTKKSLCLILIISLSMGISIFAQDYTKIEHFKLTNGLDVYINPDHSTPTVYGAIVVKVGSKNDPKEATGMAHYFEHIMFKGTEKIGTINYAAEKVFLDSIVWMYDSLRLTEDAVKRQAIQLRINELSLAASEYAIPNEIDKLLQVYGGSEVNAFTSFDETCYFNAFPSFQIEPWLDIYSERFRAPVFRLFQSELETVYEEKNMYSDNDFSRLFDEFLKYVYKNHPYGQQTTIGSAEHLKNPSLSKMAEFYKNYYVANNMALILIGDVKTEEVKPLIEAKFGILPSKAVPVFDIPKEEAFTGEIIDVKGTPVAMGLMGFRSVAANHPDEKALLLCNQILSNGSTGLLDKLSMENKLLATETIPLTLNDYGANIILFVPKILGQKFEEAEAHIFGALDSLRQGKFDEEILASAKLSMEKELLLNLEDAAQRGSLLMQSIVNNTPWEQIIKAPEKINKITKEDIIRVANTYYPADKFLILRSHMGSLPKDKIEKPNFKPIVPQNGEAKSDYAVELAKIPSKAVDVKFVDFNTDLEISEMQKGVRLYNTPNPVNQLFSLEIKYGIGTYTDKYLNYAAEYMGLLGSEKLSFDSLKRELQKLGAEVFFNCNENYFSISITGFDAYFTTTMQLIGDLLKHPRHNEQQLKTIYEGSIMSYKSTLQTPSDMGHALQQYILYGAKSTYLDIVPQAEVKKFKSADLLKHIQDAMNYGANVIYSGNLSSDSIKNVLLPQGFFAENPKDFLAPVDKKYTTYSNSKVFFINDKKAAQSQIYIFENTKAPNMKDRAVADAFNQYFGSGMSSLVFQEIREFRSFAYGASAQYVVPLYKYKDQNTIIIGQLQTQNDKAIDALTTLVSLFKDMPEKPNRLPLIKANLLQSIYTEMPNFRNLGNVVASWQVSGYTEDPRIAKMDVYKELKFSDITDFYTQFVQNGNLIYCIYGDMSKINKNDLKKLGELVELKTKDIVTK